MKKTNILIAIFFVLATIISCNQNSKKTEDMNTTNHFIFPKGTQGSPDWFTGKVWVNILLPKSENINYVIGDVKFEPKARTFWHTHPAEQILLVTEGKGFYQEKGKSAKPLTKGDVVVIPTNVEHWHGASSDSLLVHIAITNYKGDENVHWLNPVTDEEYYQAIK